MTSARFWLIAYGVMLIAGTQGPVLASNAVTQAEVGEPSADLSLGGCAGTLIDFDSIAVFTSPAAGDQVPVAGSVVTTQFMPDGALFGRSGVSAGVAVVRDSLAPSSPPNTVAGLNAAGLLPGTGGGAIVGDIYFSFVVPNTSTPAATDFASFTIGDNGGDLDVFQIRSYGLDDTLIDTQDVSGNSRFLVTINVAGIHRVEVDFMGEFGYSLDDLCFNAPEDPDMLEPKLDAIEVKLDELKPEVVDIKAEITDIKAESVDIKAEITDIKAESVDIKAEITDIKAESVDIKAEITEIAEKLDFQIDLEIEQALLECGCTPNLYLPEPGGGLQHALALVNAKIQLVQASGDPDVIGRIARAQCFADLAASLAGEGRFKRTCLALGSAIQLLDGHLDDDEDADASDDAERLCLDGCDDEDEDGDGDGDGDPPNEPGARTQAEVPGSSPGPHELAPRHRR